MESVGARLRATRESNGYTLEQIARDTHIAKRFLDALENEDFSAFPGEPYLLGFMRTYSGYLGLDPEETVSLYHNLKLQEQPPPIEELIQKGPALPFGKILLIILAVAVVGGGTYFAITSGVFERDPSDPGVAAVPDEEPAFTPTGDVHEMTDEIIEQRFSVGDRIFVPVVDERFSVDLTDVNDGLQILVNGEERTVAVGQDELLDLNADGRGDLRIIVRSVDELDSPSTVVMRLDRGSAATATVAPEDPIGVAVEAPAVGSTLEQGREETARLIASFNQRDEFTVEVRFEGYSLFRYELDSEERVEQYYQAGDTIRLSVRDQLKLWASNAASTRLRVAGTDISLGNPGQVTAGLVTWVTDPESGAELLELLPVY